MVEVFKDVTFRLAPHQPQQRALHGARGIKGFKLLNGFRGNPKVDLATLEKLIVSLSDLVWENPEIKELDINPLLVHPDGRGRHCGGLPIHSR